MNGSDCSWAVPEKLEMHPCTDELFVLIKGQALLVSGGYDEYLKTIDVLHMEHGVLYNVKAGTWHWTPMREDAVLVIIEKTGTDSDGTTKYATLAKDQQCVVESHMDRGQSHRLPD